MELSAKYCLLWVFLGFILVNQGCQAPEPLSLEEQLVKLVPKKQRSQQLGAQISADGRRIVFEIAIDENTEVFLKDLLTGQETNISNCSAQDYQPSISSEAKKVMFWSDRTGHPELYDVNIADVFYVKGIRAEIEGHNENAISYFTQAVDVDVLHAPSHHSLGRLYYDSNNYDGAIEEFSIVAGHSIGELAIILREYEQSSTSKESSKLDLAVINAISAYDNLSLAFIAKENDKAAAEVHYAIGSFFDTIEWNNFAIVEIMKGLSIDSRPSSNTYNLLAKLYIDISDYQGSEKMLRKALEITPNSAEIHSNLGRLYLKQGLAGIAMVEFKIALDIDPNSTEVRQNLAVYHYEKNNYQKALDQWEALSKIDPNYPNLKRNLDLARSKLRENRSPETMTNQVHETEVEAAKKQNDKAIEYLKNKELTLAIRILDELINNPKIPSRERVKAFYNRAAARSYLGEDKVALEDFYQAEELAPSEPMIYRGRAVVFMKLMIKHGPDYLKPAVANLAKFITLSEDNLDTEEQDFASRYFAYMSLNARDIMRTKLKESRTSDAQKQYYADKIESIEVLYKDKTISIEGKIQRLDRILNPLGDLTEKN